MRIIHISSMYNKNKDSYANKYTNKYRWATYPNFDRIKHLYITQALVFGASIFNQRTVVKPVYLSINYSVKQNKGTYLICHGEKNDMQFEAISTKKKIEKRKNSVKTGKPLLKIGKSNNIHIFIYKYETV